MKTPSPSPLQAIIGAAYAAAGVGIWVVLPRRMAQITEATGKDPFSLDMLFIWFCFGLIGLLLVGGGTRKIMAWHRSRRDRSEG
jgi:hypothetical protein